MSSSRTSSRSARACRAAPIVVVAHRDAAAGPAAAELSGTAVLLELARLFADRDLRQDVVLASVSGGSGGFAGAREVVDAARARSTRSSCSATWPADARAPPVRRARGATGPARRRSALERTAQAALRAELDARPRPRPRRRAGAAARAAADARPSRAPSTRRLPAVLISDSRRAAPRRGRAGRRRRRVATASAAATLRAADRDARRRRDATRSRAATASSSLKRLVPTWAMRLLIARAAAAGAADRLRRLLPRAPPRAADGPLVAVGRELRRPPSCSPGAGRGCSGSSGAVDALRAPAAGGVADIGGAGWASRGLRPCSSLSPRRSAAPVLLRGVARPGDASAGGAAAATGLLLAVLVLVVWVVNPYAAAVLLPAAHAWLLVSAPGSRPAPPRSRSAAVLAASPLPAARSSSTTCTPGAWRRRAVWTASASSPAACSASAPRSTVAVFVAGAVRDGRDPAVRRGLADRRRRRRSPGHPRPAQLRRPGLARRHGVRPAPMTTLEERTTPPAATPAARAPRARPARALDRPDRLRRAAARRRRAHRRLAGAAVGGLQPLPAEQALRPARGRRRPTLAPTPIEKRALATLPDARSRIAFAARALDRKIKPASRSAASTSPRSALDKVIVEGTTTDVLPKGPGHYPATPLPGAPGTVAIAGHRTTYGAPFRKVDKLKPATRSSWRCPTRTSPTRSSGCAIVEPTDTWVTDRAQLRPARADRLPPALLRRRKRIVVFARQVKAEPSPFPVLSGHKRGVPLIGNRSIRADLDHVSITARRYQQHRRTRAAHPGRGTRDARERPSREPTSGAINVNTYVVDPNAVADAIVAPAAARAPASRRSAQSSCSWPRHAGGRRRGARGLSPRPPRRSR